MSEIAEIVEEAPASRDLRLQYYARYAADIREVFEHCGCTIDKSTEDAFHILVSTTEAVDHFIDNERAAELRDINRKGIVKILSGEQSTTVPVHIERKVADFRNIMQARGCFPSVKKVIADMFSLQEEMRSTSNVDRYIELSLEEGVGLGNLVLAVAHEKTNPTVERIADIMAPAANLSDHLFDAQRDYEKGEISFEPNRYFYWKGLKICTSKLIQLMAVYPNKRKGFQFFVERVTNAWRTREYATSAVNRVSNRG